MPKPKLSLYVWEHVLTDYEDGIMFALAYNEDEARKKICEKMGWTIQGILSDPSDELMQKPRIVEEPEGFAIYGGE